jgi:undecaprenyl-diphosphatase
MAFIQSIKDFDTQLFLFLNSKHNSFFDFIMFWASDRFIWIPLYLFFGFLVVIHFKKQTWLIVLFTILLILLSDQISNHLFKDMFLRYRPCHNLLLQDKIHLNDGCGGMYGFVSSHATNTFALAMFLGLLLRKRIEYFTLFIFLWAAFVSYSRIYNGVHYPADVAVGALLGMLIGLTVFKLYQKTENRLNQNISKI